MKPSPKVAPSKPKVKEQRQAVGECQEQVSAGFAEQTENQHRPSSKPIRERAQYRRGQKLHDGERGEQESHLHRVRAECSGVKGCDRNDQAESQHIQKDGEEDEEQRAADGAVLLRVTWK
jgi:hypothetical protein